MPRSPAGRWSARKRRAPCGTCWRWRCFRAERRRKRRLRGIAWQARQGPRTSSKGVSTPTNTCLRSSAVRRVTSDSRQVRNGDAFAAYPGAHLDGRAFIGDAISRGAGAVLWDPQGIHWDHRWKISHLPVERLKERLGAIADYVYRHPSHELWMVGVTGTNGKTSCAHWIAAGLQ